MQQIRGSRSEIWRVAAKGLLLSQDGLMALYGGLMLGHGGKELLSVQRFWVHCGLVILSGSIDRGGSNPDGKNLTTALKTCGVPELCSTESVNLGEVKVTRNVKCCNTTRCNTETLPVLPEQRANGKMCYSCKDNDCSQTVDCVGNELHCISQKVTEQGKTLTMKGCAVKSACDNSALLNLQGIDSLNIQCCQGNLCNGVESFTLSFLLMFLSLLSSILFY
ncbi:hypothetical protein PGIGA_G00078450 [Pangasianodon gigas]|uniref:Uncharacterized protein n=1 Tax=Pangasianodon gigas TaxID=30993 RepID=A0ACC5X9A5_PANGG|nr:hypothetical protein [Pangasianodon gigas]